MSDTADSESIVRNRAALLSHGRRGARADALAIVEAGIRAADPGAGTRRAVRWDAPVLRIGERALDLGDVARVAVVGAGKASAAIVEALEEVLGERIAGGVVAVKRGAGRRLARVEVREAGHPIPDAGSVAAAREILSIAERAGPRDLVLAAITGGASALAALPPDGVALDDVRDLTRRLLNSGAGIAEINTVRRHLGLLSGGRLAAAAQPAALVAFTLNTAHRGLPWPDMVLPDPTTFQDAIAVLRSRGLWEDAPRSVRDYLRRGCERPELETVKSFEGFRTELVSVGDPAAACEAAARRAEELGYRAAVLSTDIEGEAAEVGRVLAAMSREVVATGRPFARPCAMISGGETTVTVGGCGGRGGPNQETALAFAAEFDADAEAAFACVDTDGTDGPTEVAGGLVDGGTAGRAMEAGVDLARALREHDSSVALEALGDAVVTGQTGTNVMNLRVVVIR
jgi:glycerate-2-kinase